MRRVSESAGDDKAAIQAVLSALDALKTSKVQLSVNVKFLFDGEEEVGSPHLPEILSTNLDVLEADVWLLCDGPLPLSRRMQVFFGTGADENLRLRNLLDAIEVYAAILATVGNDQAARGPASTNPTISQC